MNVIKPILVILVGLLALTAGASYASVSISIGEPGFYGRIDIGGFPSPRLVYPEPIIVHRVKTWYPPIYLRVPPAHAKRWYKYCNRYGACGRPVYFIDNGWYEQEYVPRYRKRHYPHHRPHIAAPPQYYKYKKYERHPPKKIYPRREYYEDHRGRRHRD